MTTAKHPQGAAYNGTGALKLSGDEPRRNFFRRMPKQEPEEKRTKAAPAAQKPPAAPAEERKGENLLMSFLGGWSIRGAFLAIAVIAAVIIGTLISNAQLVMVNDQMVELRSTLSDLQDQETQLKAQYELSYDLQDIERQRRDDEGPELADLHPGAFRAGCGGVSPGLGSAPEAAVHGERIQHGGAGIFLRTAYIRSWKESVRA